MNQKFFILLAALLTITVYATENTNQSIRNPFVLPAISRMNVAATDSLNHYPINALTLTGVIVKPDQSFARVQDPNQREYWLKQGQVIGAERATVSQISMNNVQLQWQLDGQAMTAVLAMDEETP